MDLFSLLIPVLLMVLLGVVLTTILVIANKKLYVYEDPRIQDVEEMLPGANCGACGEPGCRAFAERVVAGTNSPSGCTVSEPESLEQIGEYLGIAVGAATKKVARLACAGGSHVAKQRTKYQGMQSCQAADLVAGGGKGCAWGCLGLADCERACDFAAITMDKNGLPVVDAQLCTACGDCVEICPRDLFSIQSISNRLWVACKSEAEGDIAEQECEVACTACGKCVADAPEGLLQMKKNLPVIDYSKNSELSSSIIQRCPTGAIVWFNDACNFVKGKEAKVIKK